MSLSVLAKKLEPYLVATAIVIGAFMCRLLIPPAIMTQIPFLIFFSAVVISGIYGGFWVGFYATILSALFSNYFFLPPVNSFIKADWHQYFKLGLFVVDCTTMAALCGKLKKSIAEVKESKEKMEKLTLELKSAISARDEFLSIASHELKTPLSSLKLQAQLFGRKMNKNPDQEIDRRDLSKMLTLVDKQVNQLSVLVDDMLDVGRISTGNLKMKCLEFEVNELVEEVVEKMSHLFISSDLVKLHKSSPIVVKWDRYRIEQVLTNLLSNAIRYGNNNPVSISTQHDGNFVTIAVEDRGVGIPEQALEKIFERFDRGPLVQDNRGLGLGLYISKQIVESHGGDIWVQSTLQQGSTFFVKLPVEANC